MEVFLWCLVVLAAPVGMCYVFGCFKILYFIGMSEVVVEAVISFFKKYLNAIL